MDNNRKQQVQLYIFIGLSVITAMLAYTIESWRWGAAAFTLGFLLISIFTYFSIRKQHNGSE
ncbi:MAG: hypothetical protein H6573_31140 [Lewinellaceae bacterium]|nr:hypothetical protein [Phaeodactylibacter sp.]MCB0614439.1 hypothetical protein [Phaeodactylibacter sp.]MCB9351914.1 hypothetical protein [Lewinellaceae bacterium]